VTTNTFYCDKQTFFATATRYFAVPTKYLVVATKRFDVARDVALVVKSHDRLERFLLYEMQNGLWQNEAIWKRMRQRGDTVETRGRERWTSSGNLQNNAGASSCHSEGAILSAGDCFVNIQKKRKPRRKDSRGKIDKWRTKIASEIFGRVFRGFYEMARDTNRNRRQQVQGKCEMATGARVARQGH